MAGSAHAESSNSHLPTAGRSTSARGRGALDVLPADAGAMRQRIRGSGQGWNVAGAASSPWPRGSRDDLDRTGQRRGPLVIVGPRAWPQRASGRDLAVVAPG